MKCKILLKTQTYNKTNPPSKKKEFSPKPEKNIVFQL